MLLEILANLYPWRGRHWVDKDKKMRFMEFEGQIFYLGNDEYWRLYKEENNND